MTTSNTGSDSGGPATAALLAGVLLVANAAFWLLPGLFEPLRDQTTDRLFELRWQLERFHPPYDETIVHVVVDDHSLQLTDSPYLGRVEHAQLVRNLGRAGVSAQAHDVIFVAPQNLSEDEELIQATARAGNVYYGMALGLAPGERSPAEPGPETRAALERNHWSVRVEGSADSLLGSSRHSLTFPALASASRGLGFLDIAADRDGFYRRAPLLVRDGDALLPSLPLRTVCDFLGVTPDRIEIEPARAVTLRGARRPDAEQASDVRIPIDRQGQMIVNYAGPWGRMKHYPFIAIYEASDDRFMMEDLRDEIEGKIALVSWVATGAGDIGPVPGEPLYPLSGIHANVMNTILTQSFLRQLSLMQMLLLVQIPLLVVLFLAGLKLRTIQFVFVPPILILVYAAIAALAFLYHGLILDIPGPIMVLAASALVVTAHQYHVESKARAVLRSTFDSYFPPAVVDKVMSRSADLATSAHKQELTILFSDIRSFTSHTSEMEAGQVRKLLNEYFEKMIEIVFEHQGTLDKFIGDGLMVFFGDPEPQSNHAELCVRTAIEMQKGARELQRDWSARGEMPLEIRVGINTGEVIVGNMGSARRLSYTVLGEPVNLAQRLESNAPVGGILISARTHELLNGAIATRGPRSIQVKGIDRPIEVYEVPVD